jgi:hypothetical protein
MPTPADKSPSSTKPRSFFWRLEQKAAEASKQPHTLFDEYKHWADSSAEVLPPGLMDYFIEYNTTLPSSAAVERLFSLGKRVLSPTRCLISDQAFEWMVLIPYYYRQ